MGFRGAGEQAGPARASCLFMQPQGLDIQFMQSCVRSSHPTFGGAALAMDARPLQVTVLHGGLHRLARVNVLEAFRRGKFRALVVSDVAARGLDVDGCDAVINLEVTSRHDLSDTVWWWGVVSLGVWG